MRKLLGETGKENLPELNLCSSCDKLMAEERRHLEREAVFYESLYKRGLEVIDMLEKEKETLKKRLEEQERVAESNRRDLAVIAERLQVMKININ